MFTKTGIPQFPRGHQNNTASCRLGSIYIRHTCRKCHRHRSRYCPRRMCIRHRRIASIHCKHGCKCRNAHSTSSNRCLRKSRVWSSDPLYYPSSPYSPCYPYFPYFPCSPYPQCYRLGYRVLSGRLHLETAIFAQNRHCIPKHQRPIPSGISNSKLRQIVENDASEPPHPNR